MAPAHPARARLFLAMHRDGKTEWSTALGIGYSGMHVLQFRERGIPPRRCEEHSQRTAVAMACEPACLGLPEHQLLGHLLLLVYGEVGQCSVGDRLFLQADKGSEGWPELSLRREATTEKSTCASLYPVESIVEQFLCIARPGAWTCTVHALPRDLVPRPVYHAGLSSCAKCQPRR